jgi:hypothetical protein
MARQVSVRGADDVGSEPGILVLVTVLVLAGTAGTASGEVVGRPDVDVGIADNRVVPGKNTTLELSVTNGGRIEELSTRSPALNERVLTAKGFAVEMQGDGVPFTVRTGRQHIGSLGGGEQQSLPVRISVDEDAPPGRYRVDVTVEYAHEQTINEATGDVTSLRIERTVEVPIVVERRAQFRVVAASGTVGPGHKGPVSITLVNSGTGPARDAVFRLSSLTDGVTVEASPSAGRYAGTWLPGERRTVTYSVHAVEEVAGEEYPFDLRATFLDARNRTRRSDPLPFGIEPRQDSQFVVTGLTSNVTEGTTGRVTVTLRNTGRSARETELSVDSTDGRLAVDGGARTRRFVGGWPAGAERTVAFDVVPDPSASAGVYTLDADVSFRTARGFVVTAGTESIGVPVEPEASFRLDLSDSELAVGEEGRLRGTIENRGPGVARDAVVLVSSRSPNVVLSERALAVGEFGPGERVGFTLDVAVSPAAEAGPRPFNVTVRYRTDSGRIRVSDSLIGRQQIAPPPDRLAFRTTDTTLGIDTSERFPVRVTNVGDRTLRNVSIGLTVGPPLSSESPTAFVERLAPGESAVVGFEVSVSEEAVESTLAVGINASAETAGGDVIRTDTTRLAVSAVEPGGPGGESVVVGLGALVVTVLFVVGWWWLRR